MTIWNACRSLIEHLGFVTNPEVGTYISAVSVAGKRPSHALYVWTLDLNHPGLKNIPTTWEGYDVVVAPVTLRVPSQ